ncbi:hypothetical protein PG994_014827 [Apiospora phragmitis]|uniref:Uncharacterized protein n=1 Tax=Apiospora phragmitis TaxID=2905665 RepID=A0ABR1SWJ1_9PEZI
MFTRTLRDYYTQPLSPGYESRNGAINLDAPFCSDYMPGSVYIKSPGSTALKHFSQDIVYTFSDQVLQSNLLLNKSTTINSQIRTVTSSNMKILQSFILAYLCGQTTAAVIITARTATVALDGPSPTPLKAERLNTTLQSFSKECDQCLQCIAGGEADNHYCYSKYCEACHEVVKRLDTTLQSLPPVNIQDEACDLCYKCLDDADSEEDVTAVGVCWEKHCEKCSEIEGVK